MLKFHATLTVCSFALSLALALVHNRSTTAVAQAPNALDQLPAGFAKLSGKYIDVVTDLPLSDELRELPAVFDAAVPQWCEAFDLPVASVEAWHVEAFVMLDRQRFISAGFLPENISHFTYGFQYGDRLWVTEQPSAYYRRHLLLHEGEFSHVRVSQRRREG